MRSRRRFLVSTVEAGGLWRKIGTVFEVKKEVPVMRVYKVIFAGSFRIGSLGDAPVLFESIDVEKPQCREAVIYGTRRQLVLLKQLGLVLTNVPQAQTVRRTVESSSKIFDCADVIACGMLRVVTTLEFLQHHFA